MNNLEKLNIRVGILQDYLKDARDYLEKNPQTDTSATFPSYVIDGVIRDIDSIHEEIRILTFIQPYL